MKELECTSSVCPACFKEGVISQIDAQIVEEDGKVYIVKECDKHGQFKEIYFNDADLYHRWMKYRIDGEPYPEVKTHVFDEPALYDTHMSQTVLTNLLITNRCDLRCSYCFMNAGASGVVYEPSLDEIREMMKKAREQKPMGSKALQITGGEPTIREDLMEIIDMGHELGFSHMQLNTNGIKLADSVEYCKEIKKHGVNTVYLSFDGVSPDTNPWFEKNKQAIANLREAKIHAVLVPCLIGGKNLHEAGKIIRFAIENLDVVRGVNFQPVSFCGRITKLKDEKRDAQRVDYVKMLAAIEDEFDCKISRDDFYPVPFVYPISRMMEFISNRKEIEFTAHPGCGGATYVFFGEDGEVVPVTRFIDVEKMMEFIREQSEKKGALKKVRVGAAFWSHADEFIDETKAPKDFNLKQILKDAILGGSYDSLRAFHYKSLFIGSMWFQDAFNLNVDRLQHCCIHYATEEGIVPFCSYNGLGIGDKIREKYSLPIKEWEEQNNRKMKDDLRKDVPLT